MNKISGTVEAVARNGKAFMLAEDPDIWYSAPRGKSYDPDMKGSEVEFEYKENPKGDTVFYNIQGDVDIVGDAPSRPSRSSSPARGKAVGGASGGDRPDPRQQSIVRQNSLTQANAVYRTIVGDGGDKEGLTLDQAATEIVEIARIFEAYSMGEV